MERTRCPWCTGDPLLLRYHDEEWCARQLHDDRALFELLTLETMQCGLSWLTVLRKREAMRKAFDGFAPDRIAAYSDETFKALLENPEIIRSEGKLRAMRSNAVHFLKIAEECGSFDAWLWHFTDGKTLFYPEHQRQMPVKNALSERISAELKRRGFRYTGPVVVYSYLQAVGMIDDHEETCFRFGVLKSTPEEE